MRFDIFGSCISCDPLEAAAGRHQVLFYVARQSCVGLRDPAVPYEADWYDGLPLFVRVARGCTWTRLLSS
jgi:hypothetical protein